MNTFNYPSYITIYNSIEEIKQYIEYTKKKFISKTKRINLKKYNNCIFNYLYYKK